jgi:hypothetical protein
MKKIKQYIATALTALALAAPSVHAQEAAKIKMASSNNVKVSGLGLNKTRYEDGIENSSVSMTFFNFPKSELWLVGGQTYNRSAGQSDFDVGLKYLKGKSFFRGTSASNEDKQNEGISAGLDWDIGLASYKNMDVALLGDVSSIDPAGKGKRYTDFGAGTKLTFSKNHNAFFLYSNRGEKDTGSYRAGYMFLDEERIASLIADYAEGKPAFTGFLGMPNQRFIAGYDTNTHTLSSINILLFGK